MEQDADKGGWLKRLIAAGLRVAELLNRIALLFGGVE